jgi:ribonucleoside-triphosphate reductase
VIIENSPVYNLPEAFLAEYKSKQPNMSIPAYVTYMRTYAAKTPEGRLEMWWETCKRVIEGAFSIVAWHQQQRQLDLNWEWLNKWAKVMYDRMFNMKWVPAGRGLQHMGKASMWTKGAAVLNNCAFISTEYMQDDPAAPFEFLMDMSMLGVGVGFDVLGAGKVGVLPPKLLNNTTFAVTDTREGWVKLLRLVVDAFANDKPLPAKIDFKDVRKAGEPLGTMGGVASGPGPLIQMVWDLFEVLAPQEWGYELQDDDEVLTIRCNSDIALAEPHEIRYMLTSEQISDIANIAGKCVVSGGIRRSAEIGLAPPTDRKFRDIKRVRVGLSDAWKNAATKRFGWAPDTRNDAWRWAANNTFTLDERIDRKLAQEIAESVAEWGDPGIYNRWLARTRGRLIDGVKHNDFMVKGTNPCGEQQLEDGELCNLVEISAPRHESASDFATSCICAFIYGKIVSLLPTHNEDVNKIIAKNRRIGVSQTGYFRALELFGRDEMIARCREGYATIASLDSRLSDMFQVNKSVRITSIKPSGTVSLVLDVPSGIRADEAPYYIRRIRFEKTSPIVVYLREHGYPVEQDVQSPNSYVVSFPIKTGCSRGVADVSAREQLDMVVDLQTYWSDNMVSNTIQFVEAEKEQLADLIYEYGDRVKSLSFLCYNGHKYVQAPFEAITEEQYKEMADNIIPLDYALLGAYSRHDQEDKFCEGVACTIGG